MKRKATICSARIYTYPDVNINDGMAYTTFMTGFCSAKCQLTSSGGSDEETGHSQEQGVKSFFVFHPRMSRARDVRSCRRLSLSLYLPVGVTESGVGPPGKRPVLDFSLLSEISKGFSGLWMCT